jgi:hypothetical protein
LRFCDAPFRFEHFDVLFRRALLLRRRSNDQREGQQEE